MFPVQVPLAKSSGVAQSTSLFIVMSASPNRSYSMPWMLIFAPLG